MGIMGKWFKDIHMVSTFNWIFIIGILIIIRFYNNGFSISYFIFLELYFTGEIIFIGEKILMSNFY